MDSSNIREEVIKLMQDLPENTTLEDIYKTHWDTIVVGAGIGGLALAALLAHHGKKVLVVEKDSWVGGRATSFSGDKILSENEVTKSLMSLTQGNFAKPEVRREGLDMNKWSVNTGFHAWVNTKPGTGSIGQVFKHLGIKVKAMPCKKIIYQGLDGKFYNLGSTLGAARFLGLKNSIKLLKIIFKLNKLNYTDLKQFTNVPLTDWLNKNIESEKVKELLTIVACSMTTVAKPELIDTSEFLRVFQIFWKKRQNPGNPVNGGIIVLSQAFEKAIRQNGGIVLLNNPVKRVIVEEGKVKGIETNKGSITADLVVINICVQNLFTVLDETLFSKEYVERLKGIISTGGVGGYIGLDKRLAKGANLYWTMNTLGNHAFMAWPITEFTPSLAPKGNQIISYGMMATLDELNDATTRKKLNDVAYEKICELIDGIEEHWLWRGTAYAMRINGAAQMIGQCADEKPDIKTPGIDNLYLVGDTVSHAAGVGIEVAVESAILCAQDILDINLI